MQELAFIMPPNASDTSDDESSIYKTTNVLLGYASKEATDDTFSQLGGHPVRLDCPICKIPAEV